MKAITVIFAVLIVSLLLFSACTPKVLGDKAPEDMTEDELVDEVVNVVNEELIPEDSSVEIGEMI
ncbi:MAG: hypothetical protein ABIB43_01595 [archaeon]